jgi:hypothetical protein
MLIQPCKPYHARVVDTSILWMPDGRSAFKIYYLSIVGRAERARYEWECSSLSLAAFEEAFLGSGQQGVGFVTAFPHITKVFRFSPTAETVLDVAGYRTPGLSPWDGARPDGFSEFACYAEAVIAAGEFASWAGAASVEAYLSYRCEALEFPIQYSDKLRAYFL